MRLRRRIACGKPAASVPATITNWGGDEAVDLRDMVRFLGELAGREVPMPESPEGIQHSLIDPERRQQIGAAAF